MVCSTQVELDRQKATGAESLRSFIRLRLGVEAHRFARSVVSHNEGERLIKLDDILIIRAERPNPLDQHLRRGACRHLAASGNRENVATSLESTLSMVHILRPTDLRVRSQQR